MNTVEQSNGGEGLMDKDVLIFTKYVSGIKGLPFNTELLLVNNIPSNTVDLIYAIDGVNQTFSIQKDDIKDISCLTRVRMQDTPKKPESNEVKSMLLSAAIFGGNPLLQVAGAKGINSLFDTMSNNYDKVNFDKIFEIVIELNSSDRMFVFNSDENPEMFINKIKQ